MTGTSITHKCERLAERKGLFLDALQKGGSVARAARAAGVCREQPYAWRRNDAAFAQAWAAAVEDGTDALEDLALEMAAKGSEKLVMFLLKARRPHLYRERLLPAPEGGGTVVFKMMMGGERVPEVGGEGTLLEGPGVRDEGSG